METILPFPLLAVSSGWRSEWMRWNPAYTVGSVTWKTPFSELHLRPIALQPSDDVALGSAGELPRKREFYAVSSRRWADSPIPPPPLPEHGAPPPGGGRISASRSKWLR